MTSVFIESWHARGLRCPDHEIRLARPDGSLWPVTLVQMPNGTGKTTTLELLRLAFSGRAEVAPLSAAEVRAFAKPGNATGRGEFQVAVRFDGGSRLTLTLKFDFEEGTVRSETTLPTGLRAGFHPPSSLRRFFSPEFVDFFVFDGELAEHLLDSQQTDAQRVIDALFQLSLFDHIARAVQEHWEDQTKDAGATEVKGLSRRRTRTKTLRTRIDQLLEEQHDLTVARTKAAESIETLMKKYAAELSQRDALGKDRESKMLELTAAQARSEGIRTELLDAMRSPEALSEVFARELIALKGSLDRVKLPESTAREFFEELAGEAECVCGRPLDDETRAAVRARAGQYLGTDDAALLNWIKADISSRIGADPEASGRELSERMAAMERVLRVTRELRLEIEQIDDRAQALHPALAEIQQRRLEHEEKVRTYDERLRAFEDPTDSGGDNETTGIAVLKRRLRDADRRLAEITDTLELKGKRDALVGILRRAREQARRSLADVVVQETNARIAELLPDNKIRLAGVEASLHLEGKAGGSTGETLSVAYAFLSTLFNRAGRRLPFIVDSPANPIDFAVRPRIGALLPQLTHQLVAFTISPEREHFVPHLEASAGSAVQYVTLFRRGRPELEMSARAAEACVESDDGCLVTSRPFFFAFQLEREAD